MTSCLFRCELIVVPARFLYKYGGKKFVFKVKPIQANPLAPSEVALTGKNSRLSPAYIVMATPHCLRLLAHRMRTARSLALLKAGKRSAARIAMIAITTSSSMSVNPFRITDRLGFGELLITDLYCLFCLPARQRGPRKH